MTEPFEQTYRDALAHHRAGRLAEADQLYAQAVALKPDLFVSRDELKARMHTLTSRIHSATPAAGVKEVLMPGDPEARLEKARLVSGIPYGVNEVDDVQKEAVRAGLPPLAVSESPHA